MQLEFTVEDKGFEAALRSLDKPTARRVMKRALNDTANKARTMLADKARETYAVKKSGFKRNARLKRASGGNLAANHVVDTLVDLGWEVAGECAQLSPVVGAQNLDISKCSRRTGACGV